MRTCYRCLLWMHPPVFRREYAGEMLWIFDQTAESQGATLFLDGIGSLARQWLLRSGWWRVALALSLAAVQMIFGGLAAVLFGPHGVVDRPLDPSLLSLTELGRQGPIAHQPLTLGIVMYLAVFITGGLLVMVIGLTFWMRHFAMRRQLIHKVR